MDGTTKVAGGRKRRKTLKTDDLATIAVPETHLSDLLEEPIEAVRPEPPEQPLIIMRKAEPALVSTPAPLPPVMVPRIEQRASLRKVFKFMNGFMMVPMLRLNLARYMVNPLSGYFMLIKTTGRRSGKPRYAPVNYTIIDGAVYCMAGFGEGTHWLSNLRADPHVEVWLPGRTFAGLAQEVTGTDEAGPALLGIIRSAGFAAGFAGVNPLKATGEEVLSKVADRPVIRIRPTGIGSGPDDLGGWGWVFPALVQLAASVLLIRKLGKRGG